jgi:HSP20 family protein
MNALTELKHGLEGVWESLSEGWNHIRERAASALTRFRPSAKSDVAVRSNEGPFPFTATTWALLAGEVFEDERRVVVRLEVPGLESKDLDLEVRDDVLVVRGEKRFEREESEGCYRLLQRAYGRFQRTVPLPAPVQSDKDKAAYRNGVLKVELPKAEAARPRVIQIDVR